MFDALSSAVFPNSSSLASTWNPDLIESVGVELGHECKLKSVQTLLAPTVNLHRDPRGGRNFECYSEDPIHTAVIAAAYVKGKRFCVLSNTDQQVFRALVLEPVSSISCAMRGRLAASSTTWRSPRRRSARCISAHGRSSSRRLSPGRS